MQGHLDSPLNSEGLAQAELLGARLAAQHQQRQRPFDAFYCSDLGRTQQTAQPFIERSGMQPVLCPRLRERHLGVFQGLTGKECAVQFPEDYARFHRRDPKHEMPGGESIAGVYQRTRLRFEELAAAHEGQHVLVITHGGILDVLNRFVRNLPLDHPRDFTLYNASVNEVSHESGGAWDVLQWGDISHLTRDATLDDF
jgi:2,3-bisphosphoglycerate-dependent phosphoglycerate mutase